MKNMSQRLAVALCVGALALAPACDKKGADDASSKKAGDKKADDKKAGDKKSGDKSAGDKKADDKKAGDKKADDKKAGDKKAGDKKAGDKKADAAAGVKTNDALANLVIKALASGKADGIKAAVMTMSDLEEASGKSDKPIPPDMKDKIFDRMTKGINEGFGKLMAKSKEAGIDWSKVKVDNIEEKKKERGKLVEYRLKVHFTHGDKKHILRLRATGVDRGLVFTRPPRLAQPEPTAAPPAPAP